MSLSRIVKIMPFLHSASFGFVVCQPVSTRSTERLKQSAFPDATTKVKVSHLMFGTRKSRISTIVQCSAESMEVPSSPTSLVQSWSKRRSISSSLNGAEEYVNVLILSNYCQRAVFAEKQMARIAERYAVSRRLLILSAGIDSKPGDSLPFHVVSAARDRKIDLSDERPCASFDLLDCM